MPTLLELRLWTEKNRDFPWDVLRTFLGVCLFLKGLAYLATPGSLIRLMTDAHVPLASPGLAEVVAVTHVVGGAALAFGIFTRLAALLQIPNVLGALLFVHLHTGLFSEAQTLELDVLVLVMLALFAIGGAGRWSVDWHFERHTAFGPSRTSV